MDDKEPFLSRWSRRKLQTGEEAVSPATREVEARAAAANPVAVTAQAIEPVPLPELPPVESLDGLKSDYRDFLHPRVDEKLRQTALKKLFSDPHFNVMDRLDTYIDDYSIADPIPDAMLRQLNQAKNLFLFDQQEQDDKAGVVERPVADNRIDENSAGVEPVDAAAPAGAVVLSEAAQTNSKKRKPDA